MMTGFEELEMLAKDCEELALDAQNSRDEGLKRAHLSIAYRIRHAVKKLHSAPPEDSLVLMNERTKRAVSSPPNKWRGFTS